MRRLGALVAAVLLAGCGSGEGDPSGSAVRGTGYAFTLPEGWTASSDGDGPAAKGSALDVQIVRDGNRGIQPTINVIEVKSSGDLRAVADRTLGALAADPARSGLPAGTRISGRSRPRSIRVDGDRALEYAVVVSFESVQLPQRQIVVAHEGAAFSISLTTDRGGVEAGEIGLSDVLDSWDWND